jgi:hypothetical protein
MDKTSEIVALRKQGKTIRAISQKTGIPRSTVHQIIKRKIDKDVDSLEERENSLLIHLPVTFFCPSCGKEQRHAYLCPICGKFIPAECETDDCCWEGFDLSAVKLGQYKGYPSKDS